MMLLNDIVHFRKVSHMSHYLQECDCANFYDLPIEVCKLDQVACELIQFIGTINAPVKISRGISLEE